jgi:hypothetical protein
VVIQDEQNAMNWLVGPTGGQIFINMFNTSYENVTCVLVPGPLDNEPKRPLPVPERRWRDVFMNYVGPLPPSTFMGITYEYVLVFVVRLTKMRHLVPTTSMEVEEATNCFYAHV